MREGWDVARGAKSVNNQMVMEMCVVVVVHIYIVCVALLLLSLCIPLLIVCSSSVISILRLGGRRKNFLGYFPAFPGKFCKQFSRHFFKQCWEASRISDIIFINPSSLKVNRESRL